MLELVNRARLDPKAEAKRFGIGLNEGLAPGTLDAATKEPLAMNGLLIDSSRAHSQWMLDEDIFSHTGEAGSTPHERMEDAGYVFGFPGASGENIAVSGSSGTPDLTALIISQHEGLFRSPGHRTNILDSDFGFREIGIGQKEGTFVFEPGGPVFNSSMVTQNFARSGDAIFLTGVVYDDTSGDEFYSVGEGEGGVAVAAGGNDTDTTSSGGYALTSEAGKVEVTFGNGSTAVKVRATLLNENAKLDLVDGNALLSSVSLKLRDNVEVAFLLGLNDLDITGSGAAETLVGNKGKNKLAGGGGKDTIAGDAGKLEGGGGRDVFLFRKISDSTAGSKGRDTVLDLKRGQKDRIDLQTIDARTDAGGNDDFTFIKKDAFSGTSGELRYREAGGGVLVQGDVNGDGTADFSLKVASLSKLQADDFIL